ncbi:hypothetical protein B9Z19DRAFT_1088720 [Tuber borchii]|uniref:Uncharacterized protein n=1 Tax=Tuber borchii TaxID=42251 RepID=A0A2T6ZL53_TUBBO|nr:hypothetical protein B9Z19DRAFT_1088720 [Tuber borchii]
MTVPRLYLPAPVATIPSPLRHIRPTNPPNDPNQVPCPELRSSWYDSREHPPPVPIRNQCNERELHRPPVLYLTDSNSFHPITQLGLANCSRQEVCDNPCWMDSQARM